MPTTISVAVDTVDVPPREPLHSAITSTNDGSASAWYASSETSNKDYYIGLRAANGQPYSYPAPTVCVRNTFVDLPMPGRDPSLEAFFEERRINSSPATYGEMLSKLDEEVPLRTIASSATSECSWFPSTPPPEVVQDWDVSDLDDMATAPPIAPINCGVARRASCATEVFPRGDADLAGNAPTDFMPQAGTCGRTLGDYRDAGTQYLIQRAHDPSAQSQYFVPIQDSRYAHSGNFVECEDVYQSKFGGYRSGCEGLESGFEQEYLNPYPSCYQARHTTNIEGYQPFLCPPATQEVQALRPQVLQLSTALERGVPSAMPGTLPSASALPMSHPSVTGYADESQAVPTRGSMLHASGRCKPCAFMYTKGCGNSFECEFCHLCEPGEKKKRRKDKVEGRRIMRELRTAFSFNGYSGYSG